MHDILFAIFHKTYFEILKDSTTGTVDKWFKREGEQISASDKLCEVTLDGITIHLNTGQDGYLVDIIKEPGQVAHVEDAVALYVTDKESFLNYLESAREESKEESILAKVKEEKEENLPQKFDNKLLIRELRHLLEIGKLEEGSGMCINIPYIIYMLI